MRILITILFLVSYGSVSMAADIGDSNIGNVKDTGHLLKNLASEQSKKITAEINEIGPCRAWAGALISTCKESMKGGSKEVIGPPITLEKIYFLSTVVKKSQEYDQSTNQNQTFLPSKLTSCCTACVFPSTAEASLFMTSLS